MQKRLPCVSSEGGPILIGDYERILKWRGVENGGADYTMVCSKLGFSDLTVIDEQLLAWDFGGPGTGYVLFKDDAFIFVRTWADREIADDDILRLSNEMTFSPTEKYLVLATGILVFLWAPEDGASITSIDGDFGIPTGDFSMGGTAYFQKCRSGKYQTHSAKGMQNEIEFTAIRLFSKS